MTYKLNQKVSTGDSTFVAMQVEYMGYPFYAIYQLDMGDEVIQVTSRHSETGILRALEELVRKKVKRQDDLYRSFSLTA